MIKRVRFRLRSFARANGKRPLFEIDLHHVVGDDPRAEVHGLLPHQFHQLRARDRVLFVQHVHDIADDQAQCAVSRNCFKMPAGKPA